MDKKVFIEYLEKIEDYIKKEQAIDIALRALSPDFGGFSMGDILSDMVKLLSLCSNDTNHNLDYYVWEYDCGKNGKDKVFVNNEPIPFETPEDVYNLIMEEQIDTKDDSISNYLIEERNKYKRLYENEKDHSDTLQRIIDKTLDAIVDDIISEDVRDAQNKTTIKGKRVTYDDLVRELEKNEK